MADPEIWLLAGQSNMEGQGDLADAPSPHPQVRRLTDAGWVTAQEPLHPTGTVKGVGPGLWFARQRVSDTGRPVDLIPTAVGGTGLDRWLTDLYDRMLTRARRAEAPLTGVLWYQGCNDTNPTDAPRYADRLVEFVTRLRADLGQPTLPVLVAQIGRTVGRFDDEASWTAVQEAQRRLPERLDHVGVVATVDLELDDWIHLSGRAQGRLGRRFALEALRLVDRLPGARPAPRPRRAVWDPSDPAGWSVRVEFDDVVGGWHPAVVPGGFALVDASGRDQGVVCRTRVDQAVVHLRTTTDDLSALRVAYAPGTNPTANFVDGRGHALAAFTGLVIEGLPPVTPWVRRWHLHSLPLGRLADLSVPSVKSPAWSPHTVKGWWYLVLTDRWPQGAVAGRTTVHCSEAMEVELRVGNDVPFRFFVDGAEVLAEDANPRLTSNNIAMEHHRAVVALVPGPHELAFVAHPRPDGGLGLDLRLARRDRPHPLPEVNLDP